MNQSQPPLIITQLLKPYNGNTVSETVCCEQKFKTSTRYYMHYMI